ADDAFRRTDPQPLRHAEPHRRRSISGNEILRCAQDDGIGHYLLASFFAYFLWKRSMRPAESTSFCLPVKKGWHFEQISTRSSFLVEPVVQVSPQAQCTGTC